MSDSEFDLTDIDESTQVQHVNIAEYDFKNQTQFGLLGQRVSQDSIVRYESEFSPDRLILASPPKPEPKHALDVDGRFYTHMRKVSDKLKRLGQELEESKLAGCTFTPKVNSRKCKRRSSMYEYAMEYEQNKQKKLELCRTEFKKQKEFQENLCAFKPSLCPKSIKLRSKSVSKEPAFEQLYKNAFTPKKEVAKQLPTFAPDINARSSSLRRSKSISDCLYKDALRRMSTHKEEKSQDLEICARSDKLLSARFALEFISAVEVECGHHPSELDLQKTLLVGRKLEMVQSDKDGVLLEALWKKLAKDLSTVNSEELYECFTGILLLSSCSLQRPKVKALHREYLALYRNRHQKLMPSNRNPTFKHDHSFTFKPKLNSKTIAKAKEVTRRRSLSHSDLKRPEDHLLLEGKLIQKKLEFLKKDADIRLMKDCTFCPKPRLSQKPPTGKNRNLEMYQEATKLAKKQELDFEQRDFERVKSECIFQPNKGRKIKLYKQALPPKGANEAKERMKRARAEQERVEEILKTGRVPKESKENIRPKESRLKVKAGLSNITTETFPQQDSS